VPAGCALAALSSGWITLPRRKRIAALGAGAGLVLVSLLVPSSGLARVERAGGLANRAVGFKQAGNLAAAERDARRAVALDPASGLARFNLGVVLEALGRKAEAEQVYRDALSIDPGNADAAGNLAGILIQRNADREAVPILERALASKKRHAVCWTNLVVAEASAGDLAGARRSAKEALDAGVRLDPTMLAALGFGSVSP
jgi:protein O-GlcNAc transferase